MNTPINEDFDKYRDDFWKGLTLRETKWGAGAVAAGIAGMLFFVFYLKWNTFVSTLLVMPFVVLIGFNGFFSKNGMTIYPYAAKKIKIIFGKELVLKGDDVRAYKVKQKEKAILEERSREKKRGKNKIQRI